MSLRYTSVKQSILLLIFLIYAATIQYLNYSRQESKQKEQRLGRLIFKCKITKLLLVMSLRYTPVKKTTTNKTKQNKKTTTKKPKVLDLFHVCNKRAPLNYSRQDSKNNLQFVILTYMRPWNMVKILWITRPRVRL